MDDITYVIEMKDIIKLLDSVKTEPDTTSVFSTESTRARKELVDQIQSFLMRNNYEVEKKYLHPSGLDNVKKGYV